MYDYKFVKVEIDRWKGQPKEDYRHIIIEHAEDGWEFVQVLTLTISGYTSSLEIIFKRTKELL
ncbi:hypothetical protein COJ11_04380 [Bacillus cereus]|uniref:DUF4177 domain-containing protein n=1 Tax=Bacillus cereus TaxID=1396 RepID=UPI000BF337F0|nr:DUF4177 domain-containing protein [Bacillus cereus]PFJ95971.1 hypothetical protein COJ11_04380 [Bacillus cereus]PFL54754.1 hypothetical protein COJ33_11920 [Bacillus cereus]PFT54721.1 hypothetical protein COK67_28595 [Bacillus cereus]